MRELFKDVPPVIAKKLEDRLYRLILSIDEGKVADIKAIVNLCKDFRTEKLKN